MKHRFTVVIMVLWASVASGSHQSDLVMPKQVSMSRLWKQRLHVISQLFDTPGASISIYDVAHQTISHAEMGRTQPNRHRSTHGLSLYNFGSIAKQFVVVTLLQMQANGQLDLDQTVADLERKYGPWLTRQQSQRWSSIRIRSLLQMTSGIPGYWSPNKMQKYFNHISSNDPIQSSDQLLRWAQQYKLLYAPGSQWSYSDTNYLVLVKLIEHINHKAYFEVVSQKILNRSHFNLPNTYVDVRQMNAQARLQSGYSSEQLWQQQNAGVGARFLLSTTNDMARWFAMIFDHSHPGLGNDSAMKQLVSKQSGRALQGKLAQGFGMALDRTHVAGYGNIWYYPGNSQAGSAYVMWFPKTKQVLSIALTHPVDSSQLHDLLIKYMIEDDTTHDHI